MLGGRVIPLQLGFGVYLDKGMKWGRGQEWEREPVGKSVGGQTSKEEWATAVKTIKELGTTAQLNIVYRWDLMSNVMMLSVCSYGVLETPQCHFSYKPPGDTHGKTP